MTMTQALERLKAAKPNLDVSVSAHLYHDPDRGREWTNYVAILGSACASAATIEAAVVKAIDRQSVGDAAQIDDIVDMGGDE